MASKKLNRYPLLKHEKKICLAPVIFTGEHGKSVNAQYAEPTGPFIYTTFFPAPEPAPQVFNLSSYFIRYVLV